jgi:hypothetical protein
MYFRTVPGLQPCDSVHLACAPKEPPSMHASFGTGSPTAASRMDPIRLG